IDSGAEICLIDIKNVKKNHNVNNIVDSGINVSGIGGSVKVHDDLANDLLLGADFIRSNNFIIDMANEKLLKRKSKLIQIELKAVEIIKSCNLNHYNNIPLPSKVDTVVKTHEHKVKLINENISGNKVINLNLENNIFDIDYTNGGVRLIETVNLKPQCSTNAAYNLDKKFKNKVNVFAVGIFPDKAVFNENLMIQSCVINSDCNNLVMPIINCSNNMIQLKAGTIIAFAQKLVDKNNGELAETSFEWCKNEVNAGENKKSESFMEMFRMDEAKLTIEQNLKVEGLLNKFSKCISLSENDVGKTSISHSIKLTRDIAIKQPIRRINGELAEEVETQLQQLSDDGIIRPSNSPWSSCIVPIKKRCGGLRLAIDYRLLNNLTVKDSFPLPNLNDAVYNLHGSVFFSTLDLTRADPIGNLLECRLGFAMQTQRSSA
ncbi:unnamed protein product, partial [Rotaria socialis]